MENLKAEITDLETEIANCWDNIRRSENEKTGKRNLLRISKLKGVKYTLESRLQKKQS